MSYVDGGGGGGEKKRKTHNHNKLEEYLFHPFLALFFQIEFEHLRVFSAYGNTVCVSHILTKGLKAIVKKFMRFDEGSF